MSQIVVQSVPEELICTLTDADSEPVTGLTSSDVTCQIRKAGEGSFSSKALTGLNFVEVGSGVYTLIPTAANIDTIGVFVWTIDGAAIKQFVGVANIVSAETSNTVSTLDTCVITGHVFTLSGNPVIGATVSARVLGKPTILNNNVGILDESVSTTTDNTGQFFLLLARLAEVEVVIPSMNYRRILTVPNDTNADLFEVP